MPLSNTPMWGTLGQIGSRGFNLWRNRSPRNTGFPGPMGGQVQGPFQADPRMGQIPQDFPSPGGPAFQPAGGQWLGGPGQAGPQMQGNMQMGPQMGGFSPEVQAGVQRFRRQRGGF